MIFYRFCKVICWIVCKYLTHFQVEGKENLRGIRGAIIAVNHTSYLDPVFAGLSIPRPIYFLARKGLFKNKFFAFLIRSLNAIPFNRDAPDIKSIHTVIGLLKGGRKVLIFPEGTRSWDGRLQDGLSGVGFIGLRAGVPAVPVYIDGAYRILPRWRRYPVLHKVRVLIGRPVHPDKWLLKKRLTKTDYQEYTDLIMRGLAELRDKLR